MFVTLKGFLRQVQFVWHPNELNTKTTEAQIQARFGEPCWVDRSDGEVAMFFEYRRGTIKLQLEFADGWARSFITLCLNGVLSAEDDRKLYNVTKP